DRLVGVRFENEAVTVAGDPDVGQVQQARPGARAGQEVDDLRGEPGERRRPTGHHRDRRAVEAGNRPAGYVLRALGRWIAADLRTGQAPREGAESGELRERGADRFD